MPICNKCDLEKDIDEFYGHKNRSTPSRICKKCHNQRGKLYYENHKEKFQLLGQRSKLRRYGITLEEFDAMLAAQGGHCAVCERTCNDDGSRLCVDHDHKTGEIRGILCRRHNAILGLADDDVQAFTRLAEYLLNTRGTE
jgi:hypothetical protein